MGNSDVGSYAALSMRQIVLTLASQLATSEWEACKVLIETLIGDKALDFFVVAGGVRPAVQNQASDTSKARQYVRCAGYPEAPVTSALLLARSEKSWARASVRFYDQADKPYRILVRDVCIERLALESSLSIRKPHLSLPAVWLSDYETETDDERAEPTLAWSVPPSVAKRTNAKGTELAMADFMATSQRLPTAAQLIQQLKSDSNKYSYEGRVEDEVRWKGKSGRISIKFRSFENSVAGLRKKWISANPELENDS